MSASVSPTGVPAGANAAADPIGNIFGTIATNPPSVAGAVTSNQAPIYPGASLSPYYFERTGTTYSIDMGGGLPGVVPGAGSMNLDAIIYWFDHLHPDELRYVESMLAQAGFYTDANGTPLKTAPVIGTLDDQGRRAIVNAFTQAYSAGQSLTDTLTNAISSGQGAELRSNLPGAVLGGGNVYTIDLTQPGAVNGVANSIFQATQGRNATAEEEAKITAAVNSGAITQGLAKQQGAELSATQQYQARVNQRDIAYQFANNPKTALGPIPSGEIKDSAEYATTLLQYMGGNRLVTPSNVAFLMGWMKAQGGSLSGRNPLGSQNAVPGSQPTQGPAPTYSSWQQSLYATANALQGFPNIMSALTSGSASTMVSNPNTQAELGKWSNGQYKDITEQVAAAQKQAGAQVGVAGQQAQGRAGAPTQQITTEQARQMPGYEAFIKGGGTPEQWIAALQQQRANVPPNQIGTAQSVGAEGGGPGAGIPTVPAASVAQPGQQQTNPGDQYVNPTTVFSQNPLSPEQASYLEATTGPNRFGFAENNALHAFMAVMNMIKAGGITGA